jgi:hypothetical protein
VGLPFLAVSATAPLLQRWFAGTDRTGARDSYVLYAASNTGSMLGLLGYPTLVEPLLTLQQQARVWSAGYLLLVALVGACGWAFLRSAGQPASRPLPPAKPERPPGLWCRLRWVAIAFVPSSLMLGVTTVLSTDIPPVPMLWVGPLALYLLSFILASGRMPSWLHTAAVWGAPLGVAAEVALALSWERLPLGPQIVVHLTVFFLVALACHGELAKTRPPAGRLTEFYLWLSLGGVLGGLFNALLAPAVFWSVAEFPIALVAAALVMPALRAAPPSPTRVKLDLLLPLGLGVAAAIPLLAMPGNTAVRGGLALGCLLLATRPLRFGLGVAALFLLNVAIPPPDRAEVLFQGRSFFGVSRVIVGTKMNVHWYINGTVEHGGQAFSDDPGKKFAPFLYYHPHGPIGQVFLAKLKARSADPVGVVGLGCGCLAYYGQPGQEFIFYEIDPVVERVAAAPAFFTFLKDSQATCRVVLGDARLSLEKEPDGKFGLLVVDAFTGDAIPVHLLTAEALDLYLRKLTPDGAIAFHVSNEYFELEPVVAAVAAERGLVGLSRRVRAADLTEAEDRSGQRPTHWLLVARSEAGLKWVAGDSRWQPLSRPTGFRAWTDDYSNVLGALRFVVGTPPR